MAIPGYVNPGIMSCFAWTLKAGFGESRWFVMIWNEALRSEVEGEIA
jgi:hypothetical protein